MVPLGSFLVEVVAVRGEGWGRRRRRRVKRRNG